MPLGSLRFGFDLLSQCMSLDTPPPCHNQSLDQATNRDHNLKGLQFIHPVSDSVFPNRAIPLHA